MKTQVSFEAFEYWQDEKFHSVNYRYEGSSEVGWEIFRNNALSCSLAPGYVLLKSLYCGICSTDMARANLPFPLPQITGHELVAKQGDRFVVVDINASHLARGIKHQCDYCNDGLSNHCPSRLTLGIDRLPGGFSPYVLAPQQGVFELPQIIPPLFGVVIEPFAAALHAVESMVMDGVKSIAIVGPKRLGLLLILALKLHRKQQQLSFSIHAIIRHSDLSAACLQFGADEVILSEALQEQTFDIVYDTSGSVSGFQASLLSATKAVHVKSTHGLSIAGFTQLTRLVIDELSICPVPQLTTEHFLREYSLTNKKSIIVDAEVSDEVLERWLSLVMKKPEIERCDFESLTDAALLQRLPQSGLNKFDVAIVSSIESLNRVIGLALVRPKGCIYWCPRFEIEAESWGLFIEKKLSLQTSRCGDFARAINLVTQNISVFNALMPRYLTSQFPLNEINEAFELARNDASQIKSVIAHSESL